MHFLKIGDYEPDEIQYILDLSHELNSSNEPVLNGKNILFTFEKPSLRTKVGTEAAINHLGGDVIHIDPSSFLGGNVVYAEPVESHKERESLHDTVKNVSQWCDAIFARVYSHQTLLNLKQFASIPVVNALCDKHHPMQAMADIYTIQEKYGTDKKLVITFIGDANNVAYSLGEIALKFGHEYRFAGPEKYSWNREQLNYFADLAKMYGGTFTMTHKPKKALKGCDVFYTDSFVSMGQEKVYEEKMHHFSGYQITVEAFEHATEGAGFMHCLPAHRGIEVTDKVMDHPNSWVIDQARNRMVVSKGIFAHLIKNKENSPIAENSVSNHG